MCGVTGFLDLSRKKGDDELQVSVLRMADSLRHRGPDDRGAWVDAEAGLALGHRRLAVIDLSHKGAQPMHSACGRYVISYNGEIYNFKALREELEGLGHSFRGHSDTEVMLAAISQWGLKTAVERFNGMFAFALWDRKERLLYLVRDRLGEKPLYYGWMGKSFLFGSELKALRAYPDFNGEIDRDALALYLRFNYIPAPYSIYKGIYKILPGTILTINSEHTNSPPTPTPYWSAREIVERGVAEPFMGSTDDAIVHLDTLLQDAVKLRMVADVPLGAFLSGGIDSSTVVALMQAQSEKPVKTFTIGFYEASYNEAEDASAVARHLGTEHTELYVTPKEALTVIPRLPTLYDEPFSDSSQIPTFLVSQLARRHVTVSLAGDGGDELFAGYTSHLWVPGIWQKIGWMPKVSRRAAAKVLTALSPHAWETVFRLLGPALPRTLKQRNPGNKLQKLAEALAVESPEAMYLGLISHWKDPASLVVGASEPPTTLTDRTQWANVPHLTQWMMYLTLVTFLPDDDLVKVDRASMGVGLEVRVPLLDHRVVEFAWQVPLSMKGRLGQGKWLLRQVLYRYVPQTFFERPKMGFEVPIDSWLRGPLRDWAEALLDERRLRDEGILRLGPIRQKWMEHLSGRRNWQHHLWDVLMFQAWLETQ
ncbi:MAG: asparagine synthase (glutamine-hydrolyzing) [bacterium]|nr:asparagine synthase (glutamine-hydrolyzing) [bacterium]